ncbi:tryptophan halogenase family protein [Gilvimarinus algae]|uniref:Tryptophan 7-halogenase n=1 Tax=Gilvimarinus algae TaxID=3058037 RepID=A0ABT8THL9_9GAMM|nr:tryptophan halogenase family protein [Gilvimarinus sp. SDUM040014]MDO3383599.1 tryptophan 7-halogenase [Gilvimarinus sp. SDUM040014]
MVPNTDIYFKVIILGGGTAGWMAANLILHCWPNADLTLIESDDVPTVGVGEGSTPYLKSFFKHLGIADREWMPHCNATYKSGIRFPNWSNKPGYRSYFHPFYSELDIPTADVFFAECKKPAHQRTTRIHPDDFFVNNQVAALGLAPIAKAPGNFEVDYGYHFDAGLLGQYLKKRAIKMGLKHRFGHVSRANLDSNSGRLLSVDTQEGEAIKGDLFIDCSGFSGLISQKTYHLPMREYRDCLFNDSALTLATPVDQNQHLVSETRSTALGHGWAWKIPLTNRYGNGYVYSSAFVSRQCAEQEFSAHLGLCGSEVNFRYLSMKVGRLEEHWHKNTLSVGLSQGFVEPLEATALMLVQFTLETFLRLFDPTKPLLANRQAEVNRRINTLTDGVKDYITAHYKLSQRDDTDYWRACREVPVSSTLAALIDAWPVPEAFEQALRDNRDSLAYLRPSWFVLFAGLGHLPTQADAVDDRQARDARDRCRLTAQQRFPDHWRVLNQMQD